jgi:hypothetical protein
VCGAVNQGTTARELLTLAKCFIPYVFPNVGGTCSAKYRTICVISTVFVTRVPGIRTRRNWNCPVTSMIPYANCVEACDAVERSSEVGQVGVEYSTALGCIAYCIDQQRSSRALDPFSSRVVWLHCRAIFISYAVSCDDGCHSRLKPRQDNVGNRTGANPYSTQENRRGKDQGASNSNTN